MRNIFSMVYKSDNLKPVNSFMGGAPGEDCLFIVYNTLTWVSKLNMSAPRLRARARKNINCHCKRVYRILTSRKRIRLIQGCFAYSRGALFEGNQSGDRV